MKVYRIEYRFIGPKDIINRSSDFWVTQLRQKFINEFRPRLIQSRYTITIELDEDEITFIMLKYGNVLRITEV